VQQGTRPGECGRRTSQTPTGSWKLTADNDLSDVQNQLPAAWSGDTAETANQEVSRLAEVSNSAATVLSAAGGALVEWANQLQQAQTRR
jgi:hypothetical protein